MEAFQPSSQRIAISLYLLERDVVHSAQFKLFTCRTEKARAWSLIIMVVTAVFLGVIVAGLSILDIYLLKQCFGQRREQDEDGEQPAQFPPLTVPYFAFAR